MIVAPERRNYCLDVKQKIVWVRIPKVASTSIRNGWVENLPHKQTFEEAKAHDHYYTIMFVRDPVERFRSGITQIAPKKDMDGIIDKLWDADPLNLNKHIRPQWTFAEGLTIDYVGYFETIQRDWKELKQRFDLKDLPVKNKASKKRTLSTEQEELIRKYYKRDYELYYS